MKKLITTLLLIVSFVIGSQAVGMTAKEFQAQEQAKRVKAAQLQAECDAAAKVVKVIPVSGFIPMSKPKPATIVKTFTYEQNIKEQEQRAKDKQQRDKDAQQMAKDIQQAETDKRQIESDRRILDLEARLRECQLKRPEVKPTEICKVDVSAKEKELKCREDALAAILAQIKMCRCSCDDKPGTVPPVVHDPKKEDKEAKDKVEKEKKEKEDKEHTNRSGGGDLTNPGGGGNENGYQNPGFLNHQEKGIVPPKL